MANKDKIKNKNYVEMDGRKQGFNGGKRPGAGSGGKRPGAGTPENNTNNLKTGVYSKRLVTELLEPEYHKMYEEMESIDIVKLAEMKLKDLEVKIYRATKIMMEEADPAEKQRLQEHIEIMENRSDKISDSLHRYIVQKPESGEEQTPEALEALAALTRLVRK